MQSGTNPLGGGAGPSSFTARKSAASTLPSFELPPPQITNVHESKYQPFSSPSGGQTLSGSGSLASVGNLLTPPNTVPGDGLSPTTAANVAAFAHQASQQMNNLAFAHNGYWPSSNQQAQQLVPSPSQQFPQSTQRHWIPPSGMYALSPGSSSARATDYGLPAKSPQPNTSSADLYQLPPFNATMSMAGPMSLPAMYPPSLPLSAGMMQQQMSNSQMPPLQSQDQFGGVRLPPTPTYSNQPTSTSSPQPNPFSPSSASASSLNPMRPPTSNSQKQTHSAPGSLDFGQSLPSQQSPSQFQRPFGQYSLPNSNGSAHMNGSVMASMQQPNTGMPFVGNPMSASLMPPYPTGHVQAIYAAHGGHPGHGPASDRPFKCDQCMQSFNRNHDLKRHKRIHLAVKPYPCEFCDKSFSRKDALKRHMLVKGCGKVRMDSDPNDDGDGSSSAGSPQAISIPEHTPSFSR